MGDNPRGADQQLIRKNEMLRSTKTGAKRELERTEEVNGKRSKIAARAQRQEDISRVNALSWIQHVG